MPESGACENFWYLCWNLTYFIAPKTSVSDEAGLKITFNARAAGGLGGTFPPAASRMTLRVNSGVRTRNGN